MSKTILITGVNGFLGKDVSIKFAASGYNTIGIENPTKFNSISAWEKYAINEIDLVKPRAFINIGSCQATADDSEAIQNLTLSNVICPSIIANHIKRNHIDCQFITISTSWQYGTSVEYSPFNLYAASKQALDDYLEHYALDGLIATSLILFDTFSSDDKRRKIHRLIADAIKDQKPLDMTPGEQVLNMVHVKDAANAILEAFKIRLTPSNLPKRLVKWAIKSEVTMQVKDLLRYIEPDKINLFNLGGRQYRPREVFSISDKFEMVPGWTQQFETASELEKLFM